LPARSEPLIDLTLPIDVAFMQRLFQSRNSYHQV